MGKTIENNRLQFSLEGEAALTIVKEIQKARERNDKESEKNLFRILVVEERKVPKEEKAAVSDECMRILGRDPLRVPYNAVIALTPQGRKMFKKVLAEATKKKLN